jgi:drug/metabolite transporter (DMT)-like permease
MTSDSLDPRASLRADRIPLGILFMLGATVMFAVSSALSKWQVAEYSFVEVLFFRAIASLVTCAALILPRTGLPVLRTRRLRDHFGRSVTQATAQSLIIVAFGLMPLAGAVAINFSSPLFATLFAALWLGERFGLARAGALVVGFSACCWSPRRVPTVSGLAQCTRLPMRCCSAVSPRRCAA